MAVVEPTVEQFANNPVGKYVAATRPPFLLASLIPAVIGLSTAHFAGVDFAWWAAILTLIGAVIVHAGVNVLNDYYDALNGTDDANTERLFPFTGGSRFIQNGVLTREQTRRFGLLLFAVTGVIGLVLLPRAGIGLLVIGLAGLFIGWAYSAPPLALNSHGLGELCVAIGFGSIIPLGADFVQRLAFDPLPLFASAPFALLVANLLYINQFPDRTADEAAGKRHWVVRLGPRRARWGYLLLALIAYLGLIAEVSAGVLPAWCLLGLLALPLSLKASAELVRNAETPSRLVPAIQATIGAMLGHGLLLSTGLWIAA
ncbi:MAG: 1,4-dihydroxy-2-naphthoate polyprenyltransferase [Gammaproteobacteria bacterium]